MIMKIQKKILLAGMVIMLLSACGKTFLEKKRDRSERIPVTLEDYEAILRSVFYMRSTHELGAIGADEYYVADGRLATLSNAYQRNGYVWAKEVYLGADVGDWTQAYFRIMYANLAIEGLERLGNTGNGPYRNRLMGEALFHRAYNYYQLAQLFCAPYDNQTAGNMPGLPLRLETDVSMRIGRSTLRVTYDCILSDLKRAEELLPEGVPDKLFPSKPAAHALLAKLYLLMGGYKDALHHAQECLDRAGRLTDFNTLDESSRYPFAEDFGATNPEVILYGQMIIPVILGNRFHADTVLLDSYLESDLRKKLYFHRESDGRVTFKGTYSGGYSFFTGLAVDEILLIRTECFARLGDVSGGLADLNRLLEHRTQRDRFEPLRIQSEEDLLDAVITERRKELVLRGVRWEDLRRLNREPSFATTLVREIDGERYELAPNDVRYTWPIPEKEIELEGMEQNER